MSKCPTVSHRGRGSPRVLPPGEEAGPARRPGIHRFGGRSAQPHSQTGTPKGASLSKYF